MTHAPREGTHSRIVYDLLIGNKGRAMELPGPPTRKVPRDGLYQVLRYLREKYGLDVKCVEMPKRFHNRRGGFTEGKFSLVGQWIGKAYVSYL